MHNPPVLIFDIWALCSGLSARAPKCQKIKNGGLDQYGAGPFEQQQFGTAGVEGVNIKLRKMLVFAGFTACGFSLPACYSIP